MTRERWGWILVALAAVLMGLVTRAPAGTLRRALPIALHGGPHAPLR